MTVGAQKIRQAFSQSSEPSRPSQGRQGGADLWIPCKRVADLQSWQRHGCGYPRIRQAFSRSSEPSRPWLGSEGGADVSISVERMRDFPSRRCPDCGGQKSYRLSRGHRTHPAPRVAGREARISRSFLKGWPISDHGNAMTAGTHNSGRLSRDPRGHPAPRLAGREALICRTPRERIPEFQSRRCHDCGGPKNRQAFSLSSEPSRPSCGRAGALICRPPCTKVRREPRRFLDGLPLHEREGKEAPRNARGHRHA